MQNYFSKRSLSMKVKCFFLFYISSARYYCHKTIYSQGFLQVAKMIESDISYLLLVFRDTSFR